MDTAIEPEQREISISFLQLQLEQKIEELKQVQTAFEEYTESSHELEQELEQELTRTEARNTHLSKRVQTYEHEIQSLRDRLSQLSVEFHTSEQQNALLLSSVKEQERVKIELEQQLDESLTEIRILRATEDDLKHRFEREMEEKIFLNSENEELRRQQQLTEERFRTQINDLKLELDLQRRSHEKCASKNERTATNENEGDRRKGYQTIIEALQRDMETLAAEFQNERHLRQCMEHELAQKNAQVLHSEAMETEIIELNDELIDKAKDTRERDFRVCKGLYTLGR
uniref:Kinesinlike protein putative n=1 Tax=Albugo laibachii Nc14 TaxID=890382 RepID=F0W4R5_9STRA|nr:kinesinlike protein putative [Albugo laibachii Nc14]|eukprot:CCA16100.1 kinesinlike protein putative [Albugo laibachii Nc14]